MELNDCTIVELRQLAKENGIKNVSKLNKEELVKLLKEVDTSKNSEEEKIENIIDENSENYKNFYDAGYKLTNANDKIVEGVLEVLPDGYGFLRGDNYLSTSEDVYVSPIQIKRFKLDKGDKVKGIARLPKEGEKFPALIFVGQVNGDSPEKAFQRKRFDDLIPIHPNERLHLETIPTEYAMRIIDLISPIGKGQRGMIVAPPKVGKS